MDEITKGILTMQDKPFSAKPLDITDESISIILFISFSI